MSNALADRSGLIARQQTGRRSSGLGDALFRISAATAAWFVLISLGAAALSMLYGGLPAFEKFGFGFLYRTAWDPVRQAQVEHLIPPAKAWRPTTRGRHPGGG